MLKAPLPVPPSCWPPVLFLLMFLVSIQSNRLHYNLLLCICHYTCVTPFYDENVSEHTGEGPRLKSRCGVSPGPLQLHSFSTPFSTASLHSFIINTHSCAQIIGNLSYSFRDLKNAFLKCELGISHQKTVDAI